MNSLTLIVFRERPSVSGCNRTDLSLRFDLYIVYEDIESLERRIDAASDGRARFSPHRVYIGREGAVFGRTAAGSRSRERRVVEGKCRVL